MLPGARVGPTADVGRRFRSVGGGPERLGPVRRPQRAGLPRHPRGPPGSPLARAGPEREAGGSAAQAGAQAAKLGRCWGSAGRDPLPGAGPGQTPHPTSGPGAARCEGADGSGRVAAEAPRLPPYLAFPGLTESSGLAPAEVSPAERIGPRRPARSPWCPAQALLATPRRCPPCARALSDRSPVPERRGGAGGGRARARAPGTAGRAGWRRQERRGARVAPASREPSDCLST